MEVDEGENLEEALDGGQVLCAHGLVEPSVNNAANLNVA